MLSLCEWEVELMNLPYVCGNVFNQSAERNGTRQHKIWNVDNFIIISMRKITSKSIPHSKFEILFENLNGIFFKRLTPIHHTTNYWIQARMRKKANYPQSIWFNVNIWPINFQLGPIVWMCACVCMLIVSNLWSYNAGDRHTYTLTHTWPVACTKLFYMWSI